MNDNGSFLLINAGAPFLMGMAVGYFTKKTLKIGLFLLGLSIVALFVAGYYGLITVSGSDLTHSVEKGSGAANRFGAFLLANLSGLGGVGLGGCAGFFVGLKMG